MVLVISFVHWLAFLSYASCIVWNIGELQQPSVVRFRVTCDENTGLGNTPAIELMLKYYNVALFTKK